MTVHDDAARGSDVLPAERQRVTSVRLAEPKHVAERVDHFDRRPARCIAVDAGRARPYRFKLSSARNAFASAVAIHTTALGVPSPWCSDRSSRAPSRDTRR